MSDFRLAPEQWPMHIDGRPYEEDAWVGVRFPYDGSVFAWVAVGNAETVNRAVEAARRAWLVWAREPMHRRAAVVERAARLMRERKDQIAGLLTLETGRPIREMPGEVERAARILELSAQAGRVMGGRIFPTRSVEREERFLSLETREPLGVVGAITGFNFPLVLNVNKVGPALAGGNAVVLKPASATPLDALLLAEILEEAGLPPGVLNVVVGPGDEVGERLAAHPDVAMVTFTGGVAAGRRIAAVAGNHPGRTFKKVTLELGSNSANLVAEDADPDRVVERLVEGGFSASGQSCISAQRVLVEEGEGGGFAAGLERRLCAAVEKLRVGDPRDPETQVASLINETAAARLEEWIREAVDEGAEVLAGGRRLAPALLEPTLLAKVPTSCRLWREEAFGPVLCLRRVRDWEEAVRLANESDLGLQAGVFTSDLSKALYAAERLEVGAVNINEVSDFHVDQAPYGGVKWSGLGRESPEETLREMTVPKVVNVYRP